MKYYNFCNPNEVEYLLNNTSTKLNYMVDYGAYDDKVVAEAPAPQLTCHELSVKRVNNKFRKINIK